MPHVIIKAIAGASETQKKNAAEAVCKAISKELGKPEKYISVSFEDYSFGEWESVYNQYVKNQDNVYRKPGYTDPVTFN
jgi:phenylpyruvate tautomerase PptA (4-oxalocrotonate tautomerase family)